MRTRLVAANWKMNGTLAVNRQWLANFAAAASGSRCEVVVCAPFVYLPQLVAGLEGSVRGVMAGAQDLCADAPGAHTGDVSGEMLLDIGVRWVIVGHSERRQARGEDDALVAAKAARAFALGLRPIVCVGETLPQRDAGQAAAVVEAQVAALLAHCSVEQLLGGAIAYEPIWAIGTGRTASGAQGQEIHAVIRGALARRAAGAAAAVRILYGGSVKATNAAELFAQPDIDGGLVGGAALNAVEFAAICAAAEPVGKATPKKE